MEKRYELGEELLRAMLNNAFIEGSLVFSELDKVKGLEELNRLMLETRTKKIDEIINLIKPLIH